MVDIARSLRLSEPKANSGAAIPDLLEKLRRRLFVQEEVQKRKAKEGKERRASAASAATGPVATPAEATLVAAPSTAVAPAADARAAVQAAVASAPAEGVRRGQRAKKRKGNLESGIIAFSRHAALARVCATSYGFHPLFFMLAFRRRPHVCLC